MGSISNAADTGELLMHEVERPAPGDQNETSPTAADFDRLRREYADFVYVTSHDLGAPLRQIPALVGILEDALGDSAPPRAREVMGLLRLAAGRGQELVAGLLAFSRAGGDIAPGARVDLSAALERAAGSLKREFDACGGSVDAGELPTVPGDEAQLEQVFRALLDNALKFRDPQRPPRITVGVVQEDAEGHDAMLCVEFRDNGIGFEPAMAEQVFRPLKQLHAPSTYPGAGIGLTMCRKIVSGHGGQVTAEGRPGEGTRVLVCLPASVGEG